LTKVLLKSEKKLDISTKAAIRKSLLEYNELIETIAKAGIAVGADGIFIETHENPAVAKSDGANMLKLDLLEGLLTKLVRIRQAIK